MTNLHNATVMPFSKKGCCSCLSKPNLQPSYLKTLFLSGLLTLSGFLNSAPGFGSQTPLVVAKAGTEQFPATAAVRVERRQRQVRQVQAEKYNLRRYPVTNSNESHWRNMLWTTALVEPQQSYVAEALNGILALTTRSGLSKSQMRTIEMSMQVGTQLYLSNPTVYASVKQQFLQTITRSSNSEWVAMALSGLAKGGMPPDELKQLSDRVKERFPNWSQDVFLQTTLRDVTELLAPTPVPPLKDLLNRTIAPNQFHLYVICKPDREVLCQTVLKRNGQFVRENTKLWSVPLLLRSIHGLGWNFVRGQTPQGIYKIEGVMPKPDTEFFGAYGQFPLVKLFLPFEPGVREFLPGRKGRFTGPIKAYQALLPPSWRSYFPIQQSYWAGKIGRSLFRIHGSGEAPDFFTKNELDSDSYNWNPTIGCLSALELYDEAGKLQQADMSKILNALTAVGGKNFSGYAIVVEIPSSSKTPISIEEIEAAIR